MVVTASRTPEKKIDANADVAVVTADEIAQKHYSDVTEAIRSIPGVALGSQNASSQISFTNPLTINGSQNVVIMVDGMRINTNGVMNRTTALGTLTNMNSIDHIEILKGAASTLYGSDAQGGVINIITKSQKTVRYTQSSISPVPAIMEKSMVSITKVVAMAFSGQ